MTDQPKPDTVELVLTQRDLKKASIVWGGLGVFLGLLATIIPAIFVVASEWAVWKDIRENHDDNLLVNVQPDLGGLVSQSELEEAISSLSLDARYFGAGNRTHPVRAELHDDCATGYVYIGPNRPDQHGGFCVRITSQ